MLIFAVFLSLCMCRYGYDETDKKKPKPKKTEHERKKSAKADAGDAILWILVLKVIFYEVMDHDWEFS
ncbi:hypothetical protein, partial [Salmonella enterica]|uniref:hypothetical protein n=1 Tax=Salmonella enterica TaxID=28901 RepID=UPI0020C2C5B2